MPAATPPGLAAPIELRLRLRLHTSDRDGSVRQARDAFRYLLRWLAAAHPEVTRLDQLTREHMESYLAWLHKYVNPRTGRPLATHTRYTYPSPLLQFSRETSEWGWDGVPHRPLLSRWDLPKLSVRLPRYIPRDQLDPLMDAVEQLPDPYQRTALLLLRWSGARRGEIARLTLDCLDAYPDGHPRLRIPVGKTYTERSVPLHPQAADALRALISRVQATEAAAWQDCTTAAAVQLVFVRRGQPLGRQFLFGDPLTTVCTQVGLVDSRGRPTVTAHRFRHTVGTQLAKGGARIQTIMAVLGHRNAQMSAYYAKVSDPVVKEQYEQIIAAGGRVAGPAAEAL
ncbi:MAG TPA: tyrosine-type recombinase/integrase [Kineosporiaceae bacterium]|nr:tyrosine-type recombinase/integrase [Kineosporiaceae bacterium]